MAGDAGIGTYITNLLPRIVAARPDWRFTVLGHAARLEPLPWPDDANLEIRECRSPIYTVREQVELAWKCPRGVDLFWSPNYNIPLAYTGRLLVTVHDVAHLAMPAFAPGLAKQLYARTMFGAVRRKAHAILCDTAFSRDEYRRLVGPGRAKVGVVHLGIDDSWRRAASLPRPRARRYIVYVGTVKPHKNLGVLIQAFSSLKDRIPHDLVIVGRRDGLRTADQSVERLAGALGGRLELTGELPFAELQAHVAHASLLVAPSLYEGFGFPPLEAMAAGCPCLVSRIPTHEEVCADGAVYWDPRSPGDLSAAIVQMLSDPYLRAEMRARGARRVERFTWEQCAEATLAVIDRVTGRL